MKKIFIIHILLAMPLLAWCDNITFADAEVKAICVKNWDTNGDGELSKEEAAAVNDLGRVFERNTSIKSFDELQFFTGLTTMWNSEFYGCTGLVSIAIPNSVTTILSCVFQDCSALKSFSFSDGLTYIGSAAFDHCTSLTSVTIPDNVKNISYGAFSNCSALTSFTLGSGVEAVDNWIVNNCNRLTKIVVRAKTPPDASLESFTNRKNLSLYVPKGSKAAYQAADHWKEFKEIVEYDGDENINFADAEVKAICVKNWDTNGDGELSKAEAAAVKDLGEVFKRNTSIKSFDELQYFTGLTIIGSSAFYNSYRLTNVTIPSSVTSIEGSAFLYCYGLANIKVDSGNKYYDSRDACNAIIETKNNILIAGCKNTIIPNSVTSIGNSAFLGCRYLTSIDIPNSVTSIGEGAFSGCTGLTSITIPSSVTSIGVSAFSGCSGLTSITIPSSVTSIGVSAFSGCSGLTSITIPSSVKSINSFAFSGCSGLTSITIPSSVTSINSFAFSGCDRLTSVKVERATPVTVSSSTFSNRANATLYVPKGSKVAYQAANYWKEFKEIVEYEYEVDPEYITFADAEVKAICVKNWDTNGDGELSKTEAAVVKDLGKVFSGNQSIKSFDELQYFKGLASICDNAFNYCLSLASIIFPNSVTSIGYHAFYECKSLTSVTIPGSVEAITEAFVGCTGLTSISIQNGVRSIGYEAFSGCTGVTSLIIPKSVTHIESYAFIGFSGVVSIIVDSENTVYDSRNNCNAIIEKSSNTLVLGCKYTVIPNSVTSIGQGAFYKCTNLTSITIPNSVTSIGASAFWGCESLRSVTIPRSVTSIGNSAFYSYVGSGWVENALFDVKVENPNPVDISNGTFFGLRDVMLYVPKGSKAAYQAAAYWKEFKTILEFPDTDVNQDGATDVVDVVDIARYVVGSPSDSFHEFLADLNSDDKVNVADAVVLVNDIAGNTSFAKAWHRMQSSDDVQEQLMLTKNKDNSLSLSMDNNRAYTAFQFDLMMNIDMNVMQMLLNDSRKNGHQLLYNKVGDGHYRVVALSTANNSFNGKNGELLNIQLDGFDTDDLTIHNVHFFTGQGNDYAFDDLKLQGGTTAIGELPLVESDQPTAVYDLQGRKQPTLRRGVNIVNGKKVIIK